MLSGYGKRDDAVSRYLVQWNELLAPTITKKTRGEIWPGGSALGSYLGTRDHGSSGKGLSPQRQQGCWVLETMGWAGFVCPQLQFLQCICAKHAWEVISCSQFLTARNVGIALQKAFNVPRDCHTAWSKPRISFCTLEVQDKQSYLTSFMNVWVL